MFLVKVLKLSLPSGRGLLTFIKVFISVASGADFSSTEVRMLLFGIIAKLIRSIDSSDCHASVSIRKMFG